MAGATCCRKSFRVFTPIRTLELSSAFLRCWGGVLAPDGDSFPRRAQLINLLVALRFDLPMLFLDPDLAEALLRTDLPADFRTEDCRWPWMAFRLQLPLNLDLGDRDRDGEARGQLQYVDICLCEKDDVIRLDPRFLDELRSLGDVNGLSRGFTHPEAQVYFSGLTLADQTMTFTHRWETGVLRELAKVDGEGPREEQIRSLLFNTLLLLSQYPSTIRLPPIEILRAARTEGKHFKSELTRARFVSDMIEPRILRPRKPCNQVEEGPIIRRALYWTKAHSGASPMDGGVL